MITKKLSYPNWIIIEKLIKEIEQDLQSIKNIMLEDEPDDLQR